MARRVIDTSSYIGLVRVIATFGSDALAGYTIGIRTVIISCLRIVSMGFWFWQIPLAWLLAIHLGMGPQGVFIAMTVAFSTLAIVSGGIFRRGGWKQSKFDDSHCWWRVGRVGGCVAGG